MSEEFVTILLLENLSYININFGDYLENNYDLDKFNKRYKELLDEFLKPYALNKIEKSK